jgi:hypothetical protein
MLLRAYTCLIWGERDQGARSGVDRGERVILQLLIRNSKRRRAKSGRSNKKLGNSSKEGKSIKEPNRSAVVGVKGKKTGKGGCACL